MKCDIGFLMSKDKNTKKMVPFFVKVRSKDIVITDPVNIDDYLYKTTKIYGDPVVVHKNESSVYTFETDVSTSSGTYKADRIYGTDGKFTAKVIYEFNKDGTLKIHGRAIVSPFVLETSNVGVPGDTGIQFQLPYGFPIDWERSIQFIQQGNYSFIDLSETYYAISYTKNNVNYQTGDIKSTIDTGLDNIHLIPATVVDPDLNPSDNSKIRYMIQGASLKENRKTMINFNIETVYK